MESQRGPGQGQGQELQNPQGQQQQEQQQATTAPNVWLQFLSISNIESPIASGGLTNLMFNLVMVQDRLTTKPRYL